jgi:hypothetical protein
MKHPVAVPIGSTSRYDALRAQGRNSIAFCCPPLGEGSGQGISFLQLGQRTHLMLPGP